MIIDYTHIVFSIDVNMKGVAYCSAISQGGEKEWDFAWERYLFLYISKKSLDFYETSIVFLYQSKDRAGWSLDDFIGF